MEKLPFRVVPGGWRRHALVAFQITGVVFALVAPRPHVVDPDAPTGIIGVDVELVQGVDGDLPPPHVQPDKPEDPLALLRARPFASTRLGIMTTLQALLPPDREVWVESPDGLRIQVYVGDGTDGRASPRLIADVRALGEIVRPPGIPMIVQPFGDRPPDAAHPVLSPTELACALYGGITIFQSVTSIRLALPEVLGFEFNQPVRGQGRAHVDKQASDETVAKVARVLPELITPGFRVEVVRSGRRIPGLVTELSPTA